MDVPVQPPLVNIAPAPGHAATRETHNGNGLSGMMPYTCQHCVRKKIKCDKAIPVCSSCVKGKVECAYQEPPRRTRKRKHGEDVHERLARYERILTENGLLKSSASESLPRETSPKDQTQNVDLPCCKQSLNSANSGKLLSGDGRSRYVDGDLWLDTGEASTQETPEDTEEDNHSPTGIDYALGGDPISSALLATSQDLADYHPHHLDAIKLWEIYVVNVEYICKILHLPTAAKIVETVSRQPMAASEGEECLLFSIYHFAVFSMSDDDCANEFERPRMELMSKYHYAFRQALVNAKWLTTTEMPVLQAYVLFLISVRTQISPHTFWILTGVAMRIAQRMGLHRDGESLGLFPFDVQMRRRLFWQLLPLDSFASQVSGTGIFAAPNSWDTKMPLNINDDQIYPGMMEPPIEQKGASEMMYALTKIELSNLYTRTGVKVKDVGGAIRLQNGSELERLIDQVENTIETKYLRYCDIVNPLHFLTLGITRSAANAVRLRNRLPSIMDETINDQKQRELCILAQKILDTDCAL